MLTPEPDAVRFSHCGCDPPALRPELAAPRRILLIEDETGLRLTLGDRLRMEGYEVEAAGDGNAGLEKLLAGGSDLAILDIMLPGKGGFDVCRDARQQGVTTPVLILSALGGTLDKVLGLKLGADDYLAKPFEMAELLARVEALLRRTANHLPAPPPVIRFGAVKVDFRRAEATRDGHRLPLSSKELQLLRYFFEHRGEALSRERLLQEVWGYGAATQSRTVDVHVAWLRQKIEDEPREPRWIRTVHRLGYKFEG